MIHYKRKILKNGLTVIASPDKTTSLAAVNIIYKVGARNENEKNTGFAHLFEHLMFGGSKHVPDFDTPIQKAAGENNAFTNNDYTNYYIVLPKENIETALWVESDRMNHLNINKHTLELQKKVVIEEFNQRYLNKPYGDIWLLLRPLAYKIHPYRWNTIGISPEHIRHATLKDVKNFYKTFYNPENAILAISGDFDYEQVFDLAEKWFSDITNHHLPIPEIPVEPKQTQARRLTVDREVPASMIFIAYHMGKRNSKEFLVCDIISDLLSNGSSSRLYQHLVKEQALFSSVNAYVTGDLDEGLFVVTGQLAENTDINNAESALLNEIEKIKNISVEEYELEKVKNKFEANTLFGELNVMNKALNLCFYEMLGDISVINSELTAYRQVKSDDILSVAKQMFVPQNSSTLIYQKK